MRTSIEIKKELKETKESAEQAWKVWNEATEGQEYNTAIKHPLHRSVWDLNRKSEALESELRTALNNEAKVGDGITISLYTDAHAYTIVKRTANTITIQRDKATLKEGFKPEFIGCHCVNNYEQEYDYEANPKGETKTLRWSKKNGNWGESASLGRHEFYDYNF